MKGEVEVEAEVEEDGLRVGAVKLFISRAKVNGMSVPALFALKAMLDEEYLNFCKKLKGLNKYMRRAVMREALKRGVEAAEKFLQAHRIAGDVVVLRGNSLLIVGRGKALFGIPAEEEAIAHLPRGEVEKVCELTSFGVLGPREVETVLSDPQSFFEFALRAFLVEEVLEEVYGGDHEKKAAYKWLREACKNYFTDRAMAYKLLAKAENVAKMGVAGLVAVNSADGVLETANGLLVRVEGASIFGNVYFVDNEGNVYFLGDVVEAPLKAGHVLLRGAPSPSCRACENLDRGDLMKIVKIVGAKRPELVPVLLP